MKILIPMAVMLLAMQAQATQLPVRDLTNLVSDADHILIATVEKVDIDANGNQVTNDSARTRPGSDHHLRLHVRLTSKGVVYSELGKVPETFMIPLWQKRHAALGNQNKEVEGKTYIFLLKGTDLNPVYHGPFMRKPSERPEIEAILKRSTSQNKAIDSDKK
jgi:hypothetical protein